MIYIITPIKFNADSSVEYYASLSCFEYSYVDMHKRITDPAHRLRYATMPGEFMSNDVFHAETKDEGLAHLWMLNDNYCRVNGVYSPNIGALKKELIELFK